MQMYFWRDRADLVIDWASIERDVPANMFRAVQVTIGDRRPKPTFLLQGNAIRGPTETFGESLYRCKLTTWLMPMFIDIDRVWARSLPEADPGVPEAPPDVARHRETSGDLLEQRAQWAIWLSPRPARVNYGAT